MRFKLPPRTSLTTRALPNYFWKCWATKLSGDSGELMRRIVITLLVGFITVAISVGQQKKTDLEQVGLKGKVKTVKLEEAKLSNKSGKPVEGKKVQLETTSYGENG